MGVEEPAQLSEEPFEYLITLPDFSYIANRATALGESGRDTSGTRNSRRLTGTLHEALAFMLDEEGVDSGRSVCRGAPRTVIRGRTIDAKKPTQ